MIAASRARDRIARLDAICLALPGATREDKGDHAIFCVRSRVFAYLMNNHHGDEIVSVSCKVLPGDAPRLVESDASKYYLPAYIGSRGWVGLRLDRATVNWAEVKELVAGSHELTVLKKSARRTGEPGRT
jgi:predicted DNA-binding protein (MmcQ/YjbR family)